MNIKKNTVWLTLVLLALASLMQLMQVGASADASVDIGALWKEKNAYDDQYVRAEAENGREYVFLPYYPAVDRILLTLFYTDAALELRYDLYSGDVEYPDINDAPLIHCGNIYLYCKQLSSMIKSQNRIKDYDVPPLLTLVKELGISKEELITAKQRFISDPSSIRQYHPELTDEQFNFCFLGEGSDEYDPENYVLQDFMIEALYLEDEEQAVRLLCNPWAARVDGVTVTVGNLTIRPGPDPDFAKFNIDFDELCKLNIKTEYFKNFLKYCRALITHNDYKNYYWVDGEQTLAYLERIETYVYAAPAAGEYVTLYSLVSVTAVLILTVLITRSYYRKKHRSF